jgi:hypothetical protein
MSGDHTNLFDKRRPWHCHIISHTAKVMGLNTGHTMYEQSVYHGFPSSTRQQQQQQQQQTTNSKQQTTDNKVHT